MNLDNDPRDPRNEKDPELYFCNCDKCKGQIGYDLNDMLDPFGASISRWCADLEALEYYENTIPDTKTNAEFELRTIGHKEFFKKYFNAPLEPYIKQEQVQKIFEEIAKTTKP